MRKKGEMVIETLQGIDLHLIPSIQPEGWDIMAFHEFYTTTDYCHPIKIMVDDILVGIGTTILHNDVAWLAHIIVHDNYRNQGIGRLITENLIDIAQANRCSTIYLLATEMGEPVYTKLGFEVETNYVLFKGEKTTGSIIHSENILPYQSDFLEQISLMDMQVSGEDRMFHLGPHLSNGFAYVEGIKVQGYYLPTFGDGLIIALTTQAGLELMKLRLTTKDNAAFPVDNTIAASLIKQAGFKEFRIQKRMRLGQKRNWQSANIYNRIGGNLG